MAGAGRVDADAPRRSKEDMPPWPRGPAGRRVGSAEEEKGRGGIVGFRRDRRAATSGCTAALTARIATFMPPARRDGSHGALPRFEAAGRFRDRPRRAATGHVDVASSRYGVATPAGTGR